MNTIELRLALCLLEKDCPRCEGPGRRRDIRATPVKCTLCGGTGKVPLLEGVRKPCGCLCHTPKSVNGCAHFPPDCYNCKGRGYLSRTDKMAWVRALNKAGYLVTFHPNSSVRLDRSDCRRDSYEYATFRFHWPSIYQAAAQALGVQVDRDAGLKVKPEIIQRLRESLDTPQESLLTADEMRARLAGGHDEI